MQAGTRPAPTNTSPFTIIIKSLRLILMRPKEKSGQRRKRTGRDRTLKKNKDGIYEDTSTGTIFYGIVPHN